MNYILFDDESWENLLPLTFTRPVSEIRIGILTIREKWAKELNTSVSFLTKEYLSNKYALVKENDNTLINGSVLPDQSLLKAISTLRLGELLVQEEIILAARLSAEQLDDFQRKDPHENLIKKEFNFISTKIKYPGIYLC